VKKSPVRTVGDFKKGKKGEDLGALRRMRTEGLTTLRLKCWKGESRRGYIVVGGSTQPLRRLGEKSKKKDLGRAQRTDCINIPRRVRDGRNKYKKVNRDSN